MKFFTLDFWTRRKAPGAHFPADESKRKGRRGQRLSAWEEIKFRLNKWDWTSPATAIWRQSPGLNPRFPVEMAGDPGVGGAPEAQPRPQSTAPRIIVANLTEPGAFHTAHAKERACIVLCKPPYNLWR